MKVRNTEDAMNRIHGMKRRYLEPRLEPIRTVAKEGELDAAYGLDEGGKGD